MADEHARGEAVPVVGLPPVLVDERREEECGVGDAPGDHDVGTLGERLRDRERAQVGREEQGIGGHGVERLARLHVGEPGRRRRAHVVDLTEEVVAEDGRDADAGDAHALRGLLGRVRRGRGVDATGVRDDLRAAVEHRGERGGEVAGEVARVSERLVAGAVLGEDREGELGECLEAEVVDAVVEQTLDRFRGVAVEPLPTADADTHGLGMHDGPTLRPGCRGFELRGDLEEQVLAAPRGNEVRAHGQARTRSGARAR